MPKYVVEVWGDVEVEADSEDEALQTALQRIGAEPDNNLFWEIEQLRACRFCGCTEENACEGGCMWVSGSEDVCDNPACVAKWKAAAPVQLDEVPA